MFNNILVAGASFGYGFAMIDPLDNLLGYQLRRASALMMADLASALAPLDMRPTEASVLLAISANADATQSDIGRVLGIKRANMTPIIAMLAERSFVERSASDGRSQALRLSPAGEAMASAVEAVIAQHEGRFLPDASEALRSSLIAQLRAIRNG